MKILRKLRMDEKGTKDANAELWEYFDNQAKIYIIMP